MASSSALATIEQILQGKTTLKTQRLTHSNIICLGTELLEHIQSIMREDKEKAVAEAVNEHEKKAAAKLRSEIELVTEILNREKETELQKLTQDYKNQMVEQKRRLKAEEEQRALQAQKKHELEKEEAVKQAIEKEQRERDEFVQNEIKAIIKKLKEESLIELKKELIKQEQVLQGKFRQEKEKAIAQTKKDCNREKESALQEARKKHEEEIDKLKGSLDYTTKMFEIEKSRKYEIQQRFLELKEDYKRFQNYTDKFHSDYLLP